MYVFDYVDSHIPVFDNMYKKRLKTYKKIGFRVFEGEIKQKQNVNAIYDSGNYTETFENDLIEAEKSILISCPVISREKIDRLVEITKSRQEAGVSITVITNEADTNLFSDSDNNVIYELIHKMKNAGFHVVAKSDVLECFAVIDDDLVWHGGANLLGKEDIWDNLIRVRNSEVAAELMEKTFISK